MLKIELVPDLTHCIETVVKQGHAVVLKQMLTPRQRHWKISGFFLRG